LTQRKELPGCGEATRRDATMGSMPRVDNFDFSRVNATLYEQSIQIAASYTSTSNSNSRHIPFLLD